MEPSGLPDSTNPFETVGQKLSGEHHRFMLFIAGMTPRSVQAIAAIRNLCAEFLAGRHELEIIDLYQQPERAVIDQIIAAPTLIRCAPLPIRRLVGDLSDRKRVLIALNLEG